MTATAQNAAAHLEVVFDNGGGITVQSYDYAHYYEHDADQAAADFKALLEGADPSDWDGNEDESEINASDDEIANGAYKVFTADDVAEIISTGEIDTSWGNARAFFRALGVQVDG